MRQSDSPYIIIGTMDSRIVVDTSVFISALIGPKGPSRELIRRCLLGEYQALIGNVLFTEYEAVLSRPEIIDRCPLSSTEMTELFSAFLNVGDKSWQH